MCPLQTPGSPPEWTDEVEELLSRLGKKVKVILSHRSEENKMDRDINTDNLILGPSPIAVFKTGSKKEKKCHISLTACLGEMHLFCQIGKKELLLCIDRETKNFVLVTIFLKGIVHPKLLQFTTRADVDGGSW